MNTFDRIRPRPAVDSMRIEKDFTEREEEQDQCLHDDISSLVEDRHGLSRQKILGGSFIHNDRNDCCQLGKKQRRRLAEYDCTAPRRPQTYRVSLKAMLLAVAVAVSVTDAFVVPSNPTTKSVVRDHRGQQCNENRRRPPFQHGLTGAPSSATCRAVTSTATESTIANGPATWQMSLASPTHMFLSSKTFKVPILSSSSDFYTAPLSTNVHEPLKVTLHPNPNAHDHNDPTNVSASRLRLRRSRGILGFRLNDRQDDDDQEGHSPQSTDADLTGRGRPSGSALFASTRRGASPQSSGAVSHVDRTLWNIPSDEERRVIMKTTTPGMGHATPVSSGSFLSPSNTMVTRTIGTPPPPEQTQSSTASSWNTIGWVPWIPTRSQIESLKVLELRQVCVERGLSQQGRKRDLQERLLEWTKEQQQQQLALRQRESYVVRGVGDYKMSEPSTNRPSLNAPVQDKPSDSWAPPPSPPKTDRSNRQSRRKDSQGMGSSNSLQEWSRTLDLEPLLHRRKAIHHEKAFGKPKPKKSVKRKKTDLSDITKAFLREPAKSNNLQVKELYAQAKTADQEGDRSMSRALLLQLKELTPNDARIYRRLARFEKEEGNMSAARAILQEGLRLHPKNAYLWHGLGSMAATDQDAKKYYRRAIDVDPTLPHSYHALGTLEHSQGRIAMAMKTLKKGIEYCPTSHRLHHALGDLYRDAKMLDMAEKSYRKALKLGPAVSHGFAYTAIAFVLYEKGNIEHCRSWLRKATDLNRGRQANAWLSLAQMEEAEGNTDAARAVCIAGLAKYERTLLEQQRKIKFHKKDGDISLSDDPVEMKNNLLRNVPSYRSGDRFFNLYRTWARLEERYGSIDSVEEVYRRATAAFPHEWKLCVDWAKHYVKLNIPNRAREIFCNACVKAGNRHAAPYRLYAEYEMSLGNYKEARKILYRGAIAMSQSPDGALGNRCGLAELFHTWAVCEWHLGDLNRAESLFDNALRVTNAGEEGSKLRSYILYSIARLQYAQEEFLIAQHCIGLCLKENVMPGGNSKIWELWSDVALAMGNDKLAEECQEQAERSKGLEDKNGASDLSLLTPFGLARMKGRDMEGLMRRDPWHHKLFGSATSRSDFFYGVKLPEEDAEYSRSY